LSHFRPGARCRAFLFALQARYPLGGPEFRRLRMQGVNAWIEL